MPLFIKRHETGPPGRGLITHCAPAHRLYWLRERSSNPRMGMKTLVGGKILEGSGWRSWRWRWMLGAPRDLGGWCPWVVAQQKLTQHPTAVIALWEREVETKRAQCWRGGGKWGWDSQVGQKLESCWFLNKPYYSDPPSVAVYCVLPVTVQQRTHTGKRRAHAESSQLVISGHFGRATPFQISSWRTGCLLYFVPLWGYKQHTQVKRTTFHYAAQRSLLRVGVTNRTLACLFQHSWKDNTTADCIFPSPWEPATQRKLGGGTQG